MSQPELSVVLPGYNERGALEAALDCYRESFARNGIDAYELLVVDDGSTDGMGELADRLDAADPRVRVLRHARNLGQSAGILHGFREARGRFVTHNGMDLPFHPDDAPQVLALLRDGADAVVVERRDRKAYGLVRKVISWGNVLLLKALFGSPFWDHNFVQFFRREIVAALPVHSRGVSTVTAELILRARRAGHKVVRLTADYHPRRVGNSTITPRKVLHTSWELFRLWFLMFRPTPGMAPRRERPSAMTTVPFMDICAQDSPLRDEILRKLEAVCAGGRFVLGPEVEAFERAFGAYCEAEHCVCVNSGTSALHLALLALGVGPGDEVVTTPLTFVATAWAISYVGARPVFVDVDPESRTLDPDKLRAAITPWTRAVLPVHLYGQPADMDAIRRVAGAHGLPVVEDACQAHGARYRGRRVGGLGAAGCFSFYPGKNLGGYGEGGALVTNDAALATQARLLRDHGQRQRYHHEAIGFNYRMDAFQGAVLTTKLAHLDEWNEMRRRCAARYFELLDGVEGVGLPAAFDDRESVYHLFVVELEQRDEAARRLRQAGVETGLHYPIPVHLQPAYRSLGLGPGRFPEAERIAGRCLSLPMHPGLSDKQIRQVCDSLIVAVGRPSPQPEMEALQ